MFTKDLSFIGWDEVKRRQLERVSLAPQWIELTNLAPGMIVVDIGPGPGVFTREYAKVVGKPGKVYAIEKSPQAIEFLQIGLKKLDNVQVRLADAEHGLTDIPQPDVVFVTDVLHHTDSPRDVLKSIFELVHSNSKILIAEYDPAADGKVGPPLEHRLDANVLFELATEVGFTVESTETQDHEHYYLLLRPAKL